MSCLVRIIDSVGFGGKKWKAATPRLASVSQMIRREQTSFPPALPPWALLNQRPTKALECGHLGILTLISFVSECDRINTDSGPGTPASRAAGTAAEVHRARAVAKERAATSILLLRPFSCCASHCTASCCGLGGCPHSFSMHQIRRPNAEAM